MARYHNRHAVLVEVPSYLLREPDTAVQAMEDPYWTQTEAPAHAHRKLVLLVGGEVGDERRSGADGDTPETGKSASVSHSRSSSLVLDKDVAKLLDVIPPWSSRANKEKERAKAKAADKEKKPVAGGKENAVQGKKEAPAAPTRSAYGHGHTRSQSQPKLQLAGEGMWYPLCFELSRLQGAHTTRGFVSTARGISQTKRQHAMPTVFSALSPIKHSPPPSATASTFSVPAKDKENEKPRAVDAYKSPRGGARKPLGPRSPAGTPPSSLRGHASKENAHAHARHAEKTERRKSHALRDVTQDANVGAMARLADKIDKAGKADKTASGNTSADTSKDSVRSRMKEWEQERARLRDLERSRLREVESEQSEEEQVRERAAEREREREWERERRRVEQERQARLAELEQEREEESAVEVVHPAEEDEEDEEEGEIEIVRHRRVASAHAFVLPKISVGPTLTPPANSPLSPLFEGE